MPGVAKTLLAVLARLVRADFRRVQFTPDLMPTDVLGTSIFNLGTSSLISTPGPSSPRCCSSTKSTALRPKPKRHSSK